MALPVSIDFLRNGMSQAIPVDGSTVTQQGSREFTIERPSIQEDVEKYQNKLQGFAPTYQWPPDLKDFYITIEMFKYNSAAGAYNINSFTDAITQIPSIERGKRAWDMLNAGYSTPEARIKLPIPLNISPDVLPIDYTPGTLFDFWALANKSRINPGVLGSVRNMTSAAFGSSINRAMALLFVGPHYKTYNISFALSPRNETESRTIRQIIGWIRYGTAAKRPQLSGVSMLAYLHPHVFRLQYSPKVTEVGKNVESKGFFNQGQRWISQSKMQAFKPSVCSAVSIDYMPHGQHAIIENGYPETVLMTLSFTEIEYWLAEDFEDEKNGIIGTTQTGGPASEPAPL